MRILVTGATGFIGGHLIDELVRRNETVDALVRKPKGADRFARMGVGIVQGDVTDRSSFRGKLGGYDTIYHLANVYDFWAPDESVFYKVNVQGTRSFLEEAAAAGTGKIVYTSTTQALGIERGAVGNEETAHCGYFPAEYSRTKYLGLCEAVKVAANGAPVVTVMPGAVFGPGDTKATGQFILNYLNGSLPGMVFPDCVLGYAYVDDVVKGHILAAERGKVGQKYILANGNFSVREFFRMVSEVSGVPPLERTVPPAMIDLLSTMQTFRASLTGRPPQLPKGLVRVMKDSMLVDNSRSIRELGVTYTPIKEAIAATVEWYRAQGMVRPAKP